VKEQAGDKPAALKLVLKVGAPYTPSDVTSADSQSETVDSDSSEKMSRSLKRKNQSDKIDHQEKKVLWPFFIYDLLIGISEIFFDFRSFFDIDLGLKSVKC